MSYDSDTLSAPSSTLSLEGLGLALLASCISPVGIALQKLCHVQRAELDAADKPKGYYKQPLWLVGMGLVILASLLDFIALGMAPQIIVAPAGTLTLVFNVVSARVILGEHVSKIEVIGTVITFSGTIIGVLAVNSPDTKRTVEEIEALYITPKFIAYAIFVAIVITILWTIMMTQRNLLKAKDPKYNPKWHRFSNAAISGLIGSCNVLFAKCFAELLLASYRSNSLVVFATFWPYLIFAGLVVSIYFQFSILNRALKLFDAAFVVPIFQLHWLLGSVISGMVFFEEYKNLSWLQLGVFGIGMLVTIIGVAILSKREQRVEFQEPAPMISYT